MTYTDRGYQFVPACNADLRLGADAEL